MLLDIDSTITLYKRQWRIKGIERYTFVGHAHSCYTQTLLQQSEDAPDDCFLVKEVYKAKPGEIVTTSYEKLCLTEVDSEDTRLEYYTHYTVKKGK